MNTLFQAGTLISMLQGVYEGDIDVKTLSQYGNIGLGTFNGVDGEMIAVDGIYYRIDANGIASIVSPGAYTPFAVVSQFKSEKTMRLEDVSDFSMLEQQLDCQLDNKNIFYMLCMEVNLSWIKLRSESCQLKPYRPMAETMPALQKTFELQSTSGTIVAVRCPAYAAMFNVPGYHLHYIDNRKKTGGHVFDLNIKHAKVMIQPLYTLTMALFRTTAFAAANLDVDIKAATHQVEKKPT